ncbi:MAG: MBL fold metallo-hydrolase [Deltaproteobacteria bacterium]|nr:MBL fold metallo-hydrolase [Deltaproteobacteria bacterium]
MGKIQYDYEAIFVDVGQGDATIIHNLSDMHSVLVDAGIPNPVLSVLKQHAELEAIFITHWDKDHIGGMPAVINWIKDQRQKAVKVFVNRQFPSSNISKRLRKTLDEALGNGTIIHSMAYKDFPKQVKLIGGTFFILWPFHEIGLLYPDDRNLDSVILRFEMEKFSLLLGSDAKGDVWPQLDRTALKADIFRYPHHGGKLYKNKDDWSADELISKVNPDWVVVSVGKNNPHRHPSEEFRQAKSKYPTIQFLDTTKGNIRLQIENSTGNIIKMRE